MTTPVNAGAKTDQPPFAFATQTHKPTGAMTQGLPTPPTQQQQQRRQQQTPPPAYAHAADRGCARSANTCATLSSARPFCCGSPGAPCCRSNGCCGGTTPGTCCYAAPSKVGCFAVTASTASAAVGCFAGLLALVLTAVMAGRLHDQGLDGLVAGMILAAVGNVHLVLAALFSLCCCTRGRAAGCSPRSALAPAAINAFAVAALCGALVALCVDVAKIERLGDSGSYSDCVGSASYNGYGHSYDHDDGYSYGRGDNGDDDDYYYPRLVCGTGMFGYGYGYGYGGHGGYGGGHPEQGWGAPRPRAGNGTKPWADPDFAFGPPADAYGGDAPMALAHHAPEPGPEAQPPADYGHRTYAGEYPAAPPPAADDSRSDAYGYNIGGYPVSCDFTHRDEEGRLSDDARATLEAMFCAVVPSLVAGLLACIAVSVQAASIRGQGRAARKFRGVAPAGASVV